MIDLVDSEGKDKVVHKTLEDKGTVVNRTSEGRVVQESSEEK